jgi:hypothetical protein
MTIVTVTGVKIYRHLEEVTEVNFNGVTKVRTCLKPKKIRKAIMRRQIDAKELNVLREDFKELPTDTVLFTYEAAPMPCNTLKIPLGNGYVTIKEGDIWLAQWWHGYCTPYKYLHEIKVTKVSENHFDFTYEENGRWIWNSSQIRGKIEFIRKIK